MARKPRPVNPADGPIQAFAYDLRAVREEAGNPTYRALAALAGFSATTLSDAAGGVRQPSLEVTLAYVGACGGDVERWKRRWYELDRLTACESAATEPEREDPAVADHEPDLAVSVLPSAEDGDTSGPPAPRHRSPLRSTGGVALAIALALAVVLGLLALRLTAQTGAAHQAAAPSTDASASPSSSTSCPPPAQAPRAFSGKTYNVNTLIRSGASLSAAVVLQAPAGCALDFTGYCLGDIVTDTTSGSADMRWFMVSQGGVVSSAVVHGNPPSTLQPSPCPDSVPPPSAVSLSMVPQGAGPDTVELRATGTHVAIVGFAAYYAAGGQTSQPVQWHQVGLSHEAAAGFAVPWRLGPLRTATSNDGPIPVVAVACLGGDGPTTVVDARQIRLDDPSTWQPATLAQADLTKAERAACRYPDRG
ncbi:hypothetical protein GCM10010193_52430 [Kitasatospora atroaurantiaca]|uniref:Helix-turn-helix protein n=1 Tax=Kitasatospora atroaurantiaca TaxID=285545 RepID=A0A561EXP1_9ACTN|nr:helix-turn-helix transcriptional regulator [Kitasatospora atroaurantiaca]TWE20384.1 helix-turn-helix protein [Kitasatospora atroaurantiaca]